MSGTLTLVWYMVVAGPQGGLVVLPNFFDTREQCVQAVAEYKKQTVPTGWSVECVPNASPYYEEDVGGEEEAQ